MSINLTFNSTHRVVLGSDFFLARRPVLDRQEQLVAHELLFSAPQAEPGPDDGGDAPVGVSVIADVCRYGINRVIGSVPAILYIDAAALHSELFRILPPDRLIFALSAPAQVDGATLARLEELARAGFRFALATDRDDEAVRKILPWMQGVRIDMQSGADVERLCRAFKAAGKRLLAEGVDTPQRFSQCVHLGFDFFQGYFFAQQNVGATRPLSVSQSTLITLLGMLASDADSAEIEHGFKSDVALGLKLLRMANAPALGGHRIESLRQALMVLGRNQLQRWLQLLLYAEAQEAGRAVGPLLSMAATRGRLIELIAQKQRPGARNIADAGFTVGIMSLMDCLFARPMAEILGQMPVAEEIAQALISHSGYLGELLQLAECSEWAHRSDGKLLPLMQRLKLGTHELYALQLSAFEWSDEVLRNARG